MLEICSRGQDIPILFLDIDGVLHPEHCHESKHFCCMPILEGALQQVPECQVVITSTWRLEQSLDALRQRFSREIAARIAGVTPTFSDLKHVPDTLVSYPREAECHAWRWTNGVQHLPWLALDDRSWNYRPFCSSLLLVDGATGLTGADGAQLVTRLQQLL